MKSASYVKGEYITWTKHEEALEKKKNIYIYIWRNMKSETRFSL
jgi:membrane-bound inhibitor of C-type lysozyme